MWDDLTMKERADYIRLGVRNGITNLEDIREVYNKYAEGGFLGDLKEAINGAVDWVSGLFSPKPEGYLNRTTGEIVKPGRTVHNPKTGKYYTVQEDGTLKVQSPRRRTTNNSKTSRSSSLFEGAAHRKIYRQNPDMRYAIPYIKDKVIKVKPEGATLNVSIPTNALDSIAKYAGKANLDIPSALGLAYQETSFGKQPYFNYRAIPKNSTEEERAKINHHNRSIGNMNYFRNYEMIPAEFLVRDYEYNTGGYNKGKRYDMPPLLHAFEYFKSGRYNPGDPNHTSDVIKAGRSIYNTPSIQEWWNNSGKKFYYGK
jgi:hypothetical protein